MRPRFREIVTSPIRRPLVSIGVGFLVIGFGGSVFHGFLAALGASLVMLTIAAFVQGTPSP